jgi:small subunit ribosomal protein S17
MKRTLDGVILSIKMQRTAVVGIVRKSPHPLYKKLIKKDSKISVDFGTFTPKIGDKVRIVETKPISKTKHYKILEVIKNGSK